MTADPEARFATGPLIDHHCHGVLLADLTRPQFEGMLNEAPRAAPGSTLFDSMVGLGVRRWCAPVLDLPPLAGPDDYLARRAELGFEESTRRLLASTGTATYLVDTGYTPEAISSPGRLAALGGLADERGHEIVRLERLCEDLLREGITAPNVPERLHATLASTSAVGAKSIAAYRTGLAVADSKPSDDDVIAALSAVRRSPDGGYRVAHPVVHAWLAWTAIEAGLPLQFHVGYGDRDLDLDAADPLLLTRFLRATEDRGVPVLLLHNYPYHRHASYLAQVFEHVFMDVGLATHNTGALSRAVIREALELVPFTKMLYSSDAFGLPELYSLSARLFRQGLGELLEELVANGDASADDADRITRLILSENAQRVYRLNPPTPA